MQNSMNGLRERLIKSDDARKCFLTDVEGLLKSNGVDVSSPSVRKELDLDISDKKFISALEDPVASVIIHLVT